MSSLTTNFSLIKPAVNNPTDSDLWGGYLNDDMDDIDTYLQRASIWEIASKTADYTVLSTDYRTLFLCDSSSAAIEMTLPSAATVGAGFTVSFKEISTSYSVTITPDGSETIDGSSNYELKTQYALLTIVSDGTNWAIMQAPAVDPTPIGTVLDYTGLTAPASYALSYGQAISRTTYATLYALVGTTFGTGDGSTTFNLPDLRGRVIAGQDDMGGTSANRLTGISGGVNGDTFGATGGLESHTLTTSQIPSHAHDAYNTNSVGGSTKGYWAYGEFGNGTTTSTNGTLSTGGGGYHNNTQPTIILNKIIKVI